MRSRRWIEQFGTHKKMRTMTIAAVLAMVMGFLCAIEPMPAEAMSSITSESIREKQSQIEKAQAEKNQLNSQITNLENIKKDLEGKKSDLATYVTELDGVLSDMELNIQHIEELIFEKESDIARTQEELETALYIEQTQYENMVVRMRMMYEQGDTQMLEQLLTAQSLREMMTRADYIERVVEYDRNKYAEFQETRKYVEICEAQLEEEKAYLDEAKATADAERANMEDLIEQKQRDIYAYEQDIVANETAIEEYEKAMKQEEELIASLEAAIAEERRQIMIANGQLRTYDGGTFCFPLQSYTRVSSEFGWRIHPIYHVQKFHSGIDLAAPKGTPIYAAYAGTVVAAAYSSSMGNYVMIDHGSNLYTIYMHCCALYCSKGDVVTRGETIAGVGMTGSATGNHLHFSVRYNGEYQEPRNYIIVP